MFPAGRTVLPYVGPQLLELPAGIAREGAVGLPGQEGVAQREQLPAGGVDPLHQGGVQTLQDGGVGTQRQMAEPLQLPGELLLARPLHMGRRLLEAPEERGGCEIHPAPVGVAGLRGQTEGARAHHTCVDGVLGDQGVTCGGFGHGGDCRWWNGECHQFLEAECGPPEA